MNRSADDAPMLPVTIRTLAPDDWKAYKRLRVDSLRQEPQAFGTSYADAVQMPDAYWRERLEDAGPWMLFAVRDETPVGMVAAYPTNGRPEAVAVISVYVAPEARGMGIGRMLLRRLLSVFAEDPILRLVSLTVNTEQVAAVALYRSLGFVVVEEAEAMLGDGKLHHEYVMEKPLP